MLKGITKTRWSLLAWLLFGLSVPAMAEHGALTTSVRDPWIDSAVENLAVAGLVDPPGKPAAQMTNLEVAQLTSQAAQLYLAEGPSPVSTDGQAVKSLQQLAEEFRAELSAMNVDVFRLENKIYEQQHRNEEFEKLQMKYLTQTGTSISGYSRGYFDTYRGFGSNAVYGPMDYNDVLFGDLIFKSVPVPFVLFDADLRLTRTIGLYYAEPVQPDYSLRWISLTNTNEAANLTAGDFYRSYTPLTLWNYEIPVYNFIEPTSYYRTRKDLESMVYMDHGPDWHMRGFEADSDQALDKSFPALSSLHLQAMAGQMQSATPNNLGSYYSGGEAALDFFDNLLEIKGTGMLLWNDNSDSVPTSPAAPIRQYQVGSLSARGVAPIADAVSFTGSAEYAGNWYQDDASNPQAAIADGAFLATGDFNVEKEHLTVKFIDNGAHFYSPGAQTNRFTPLLVGGYSILDDGLNGYLDNYVFQNLGRPSFAPYDRMAENILPYGDATPDRQGFVLGFSAEIGQNGWFKPQASCDLAMRELQTETLGTTVTGGPTTTRSFEGYEGALTADLAKALDGLPKTCSLSVDYKHQSTNFGNRASPFAVDNFIAAADAGPFPHVPLFEGLVVSLAYEQAQSSGNEYTLSGLPNPLPLPTLGYYASAFSNTDVVYNSANYAMNYVYQVLDITRTSWAFGVKCPLSSTFEIHGDLFLNQYSGTYGPPGNLTGYDRREQIWRLTYEVSF